ncbi:MAG: TolC family protein [Planctomycetes bacterium]|nr:TolC family protein [Planctomycetota bacterium]
MSGRGPAGASPSLVVPGRRLGGLLLLACFPGCVSYAPDPLDPPVELRLLLERPATAIAQAPAGPWSTGWFPVAAELVPGDGLSLAEANAIALFHSPEVRASRAEAGVAGAQVLQAGLLANPELFLGPRISTQDSKLIFPAGISWDVPLWGTRSAARDLAEARRDELALRALEVEVETLGRVRESYARLSRLQKEEEVLAAVATASDRLVTWVEGLQRAGGVDSVSSFLARAERDEAAIELEQVRRATTTVRRELFLLLGLLPNAAVSPVFDVASSTTPELPPASTEALLQRPSLKAAEAAYAAADATLRREIARQYPTFRLGPEFESDRGESSLGIGLGISLPWFDRNQGGIAAAELARAAARDRYRTELLAASHAEARARDDLEAAQRLLEIHNRGAVPAAEQAAQTLTTRLEAGRADVLEILTAQRAIARVRTRALEIEEQLMVARVRAAVAGGLAWEGSAAATNEEKRP